MLKLLLLHLFWNVEFIGKAFLSLNDFVCGNHRIFPSQKPISDTHFLSEQAVYLQDLSHPLTSAPSTCAKLLKSSSSRSAGVHEDNNGKYEGEYLAVYMNGTSFVLEPIAAQRSPGPHPMSWEWWIFFKTGLTHPPWRTASASCTTSRENSWTILLTISKTDQRSGTRPRGVRFTDWGHGEGIYIPSV